MTEEKQGERPRTKEDWDGRYQGGATPWETGRADRNLQAMVAGRPIAACRAFEVGCGNGSDAIWLAGQGFDVMGLDWAATAIAEAKTRATAASVNVDFAVGSFPDATEAFALAYDRGCFHTVQGVDARSGFVEELARRLAPEGLWLSIVGSTDGPPRDHGPPRLSALEVVQAIEPHFEILSLQSELFDAELPSPARAFVILARRR